MDLNKLYQKIAPVLGSANCRCVVDSDDGSSEEKTYHVTCHIGRDMEPDTLQLRFSISLNIPTLIEKLKTNHALIIGEDTILIFVKKKSIEIIPYLKRYNGRDNDYNGIAQVFYDGRGMILMDRFGI